ncbi:MAG: hypothetical protein LBR39_05325, partial [Coriobacteriales bacterium]|nr:hypothetical protein [Coriobacteriales bacterium]
FVTNFLAGGEEEEVITLTPEQTRSALDAQMPKILDNISKSPDQAFSEFKDESGWNVVLDDRAIPNNFDGTAAGKQIIHLDPSVTDTEAALKGYYESEFSAYTIDELQTNFNGFWQLSIQSGDAGLYSEVVYINLAASSLDNEIEHFASSQGLNGENSRVEPLFEDNRGTVYQGSITVGEQTYFWQILGCELSAKYKGTDERQLPDTAVYIKCRVATYDFDNIEESIVGSL